VLVGEGVRVGVLAVTGGRVLVGVSVTVLVEVTVGVGLAALQEGNLKTPMRVRQETGPVVAIYSLVNQKVQSSTGSMDMAA
jgi:hypothetical protein